MVKSYIFNKNDTILLQSVSVVFFLTFTFTYVVCDCECY